MEPLKGKLSKWKCTVSCRYQNCQLNWHVGYWHWYYFTFPIHTRIIFHCAHWKMRVLRGARDAGWDARLPY